MASIGSKIIRQTLGLSLFNYVIFAIRIVVTIVLARLIGPHVYGLVALAVSIAGVFMIPLIWGAPEAIMQDHGEHKSLSSTIFWTKFSGVIITGIIILVAGFLLRPFYEPTAVKVFLFLSFFNLMSVLAGVSLIHLRKHLLFFRVGYINLVTTIIGSIAAIMLALNNLPLYGLLAHTILATFLSSVAFFIASPWKPSGVFDKETFKWFTGFAKKMFLSNLTTTVHSKIGILAVGTFANRAITGTYAMGLRLADSFRPLVWPAIADSLLPSFANYKNSPEALSRVYYLYNYNLLRVLIPFYLILIVLIPEFITIVLGYKWLDAVEIFRVLVFVGLLGPLIDLNMILQGSQGRPESIVRTRLVGLVVLVPLVIILTIQYSAVGAAVALVISMIFMLIHALAQAGQVVKIGIQKIFVAPIIAAVPVVLIIVLLQQHIELISLPIRTVLQLLIIPGLYVVTLVLLERDELVNNIRYIKQLIFERNK